MKNIFHYIKDSFKLGKLKNGLVTDVFWYYTLLILLLKCTIFLGITFDQNHDAVQFYKAFSTQFKFFAFYLGFVIAFNSFAFLFKNRGRIWYLLILNTLLSILLMIDIWYFRGFNTMPSLYVLQQSTNLESMSDTILAMVFPIDFVLISDIIILTPFLIIKKSIYRVKPRSGVSFILMAVFAALLISYFPIKVNVLKIKGEEAFCFLLDPVLTSNNMSPMGYHIMSVYTFFEDSKIYRLRPSEKDEIKGWFEANKEGLPDNQYKGMFQGKNLLIVQIESMENFVINQSVNGQEITPTLNKLIKNGIYFPNYYEQVNEGTSSDADLMTNTSVFPLRQGSTFFRYPFTTYQSLPKLLKGKGYSTMAMHPDRGAFWNWMVALKNMGFERCIDYGQLENDEKVVMGLSDGSFLRQAEQIISKQKQPFYTFMVTLSSHSPFKILDKHKSLTMESYLEKSVLGDYFHAIHYTDRQLGIFIDKLDKSGLLKDTVIVMYGDHCGVHKYYPSYIPQIKPSSEWWLDNQKKVPLIIYQKDLKPETIQTTGGQIDLLPTIAYLMGIDETHYINTAMGRNLLKTKRDYAVLQDKKIMGSNHSDEDKAHAVKALEIADMILKSNYFKPED